MLKDAKATISFSVDDLVKAKEFYGSVLGLDVDDSLPGMLFLNLANDYQVFVYQKSDHKPAVYTLLNFSVDDLPATMEEMKAKGAEFEHYNLPEQKLVTDAGGVADYGVMKIAFFNDPAGNNHAVLQMTS